MCLDPITLASLTLAAQAGSSFMQYQGQQAQADYQDKANANLRKQFAQEADQRRMDGERQRQQEYEQAASEVNQYHVQAMRERSSLDALLGEYGGGVTADRRMSALGSHQGQDLATIRSNAGKRQSELGFQESGDIASIQGRVTSLRAAERPSLAGLGLSLAGSALQFGNRRNEINKFK